MNRDSSHSAPFIPVKPIPPPDYPGPLRLLKMARKDLLSFWPEEAYRSPFFGGKVFNRSMFVANSPDTVEHVFVSNHDNYNRKSPFMRKALEPLLGDGLFISEGEVWSRRRSLEAPAFSSDKLKMFTGIMVNAAAEMRENWQKNYLGREFLVLPEMAILTAEIISRSLFGEHLGREKTSTIVQGFSDYQATIEQFDWISFFGLPKWFPRKPTSSRTVNKAKEIQGIVDALIHAQVNRPSGERNLLSMLLQPRGSASGAEMSLEQVRHEAMVILMAGHETTANSLAWTWYLLAHHPEVEGKLHRELDEVLAGRLPTHDDVQKLTYTRAVFDEALRLYPPVPILSRQAINKDCIRNRDVPAGSIMLVIPWLLHRHQNLWEKPDQFIPERFSGEWPSKHDKYAYVPFSAGPRFCLGAAFGLTEAVLCLAILAQHFSVRAIAGRPVSYDCRLSLRPAAGLPMKLQSRK